MEKIKTYIIIAILILTLILVDQIIKNNVTRDEEITLIEGILKITYMENTGGAFSIASDNVTSIIFINIIILAIVIRFLIRHISNMNKVTKFTICLVLAGGISNFLDRIIKGFVIDYIDVNDILNFPIFNLADIYVVLGWLILIFLTIIYTLKDVKKLKSKTEG